MRSFTMMCMMSAVCMLGTVLASSAASASAAAVDQRVEDIWHTQQAIQQIKRQQQMHEMGAVGDAPSASPLAVSVLFTTTPAPSPAPTTGTYLSLYLWQRDLEAVPSTREVVWKTVPMQYGSSYLVSISPSVWFAALIGIYGSGWTTSGWVEATPDGVYTAEVSDTGIFSVAPHSTTGSCQKDWGGPVGCMYFYLTCAAGSTCISHPWHLIRSDQSGIWMEYIPVSPNDGGAIFAPELSALTVGFGSIDQYKAGDPVDSNLRAHMLQVPLPVRNAAQGLINRPPPATVIVDLARDVLSLGSPLDPHGSTCSQSPQVGPRGCVTLMFNWTNPEVYEQAAVWMESAAWDQPTPTGTRPTVWKVFDIHSQMISFPIPLDYYVGVMQFVGTTVDTNEYLLSPLLLAQVTDIITVTTDAAGTAYLARTGTSQSMNVEMAVGTGATFFGKTNYFVVFKGGDAVASSLIMPNSNVQFQLDNKVFFRADSSFSKFDPVQDFDLQYAVGFQLNFAGMQGVRTVMTNMETFVSFTPAQSCASLSCGVHGTCDVGTGLCVCIPGWSGAQCAVPTAIASSSTGGAPQPPAPTTSTGSAPPTPATSTAAPAPIIVASSTGSSSAPNGSFPSPPLLPGVVWSYSIGTTIVASHLTMGLLLPSWSFHLSLSFFQFAGLCGQIGASQPESLRSFTKQVNILNFQFEKPQQMQLQNQNPVPQGEFNTTNDGVRVFFTSTVDDSQSQSQGDLVTAAQYAQIVKDSADVFTLTLFSLLATLGAALLFAFLVLAIDRALHGPLNEYEAINALVDEEKKKEQKEKEEEEKQKQILAPVGITEEHSTNTHTSTNTKDVENGDPLLVPSSGDAETDSAESTDSSISTPSRASSLGLLGFLRSSSCSYRLHVRVLPRLLLLHVLRFGYYGLLFASYRHAAWFSEEHTSPLLNGLAWLCILFVGCGFPFLQWKTLQNYDSLLLESQALDSHRARIKVRLFALANGALLDDPLRAPYRVWALAGIIKRNLFAASVGILSLSTVNQLEWNVNAQTASTVQIVTCIVLVTAYVATLAYISPYASRSVNRLHTLFELVAVAELFALLFYNVSGSTHHSDDSSPSSNSDDSDYDGRNMAWIRLVHFLNILAGLISLLLFSLMTFELLRPYHSRLSRRLPLCCVRSAQMGWLGSLPSIQSALFPDTEEEMMKRGAAVVAELNQQQQQQQKEKEKREGGETNGTANAYNNTTLGGSESNSDEEAQHAVGSVASAAAAPNNPSAPPSLPMKKKNKQQQQQQRQNHTQAAAANEATISIEHANDLTQALIH